jgi:hypothetical protein
MRHSNMIGYVIGCIGILTVGAALAKDPEQTAERGLSTPAGCTDSVRGRTHILRFCGDKHYWLKTQAASPFRGALSYPEAESANAVSIGNPGAAQNWGGFQRY